MLTFIVYYRDLEPDIKTTERSASVASHMIGSDFSHYHIQYVVLLKGVTESCVCLCVFVLVGVFLPAVRMSVFL